VGATMGVAALESPTTCSGINCHIVGKTIVGWVVTLIVVGGTTALLTAQGAHAPEVGVYPCDEL
jgi:sodium-dependent phosphate transporter